MLCYSLGEMKTNLFSFNLCSKFVFILRVNAWLSIISRTNYIHRYAQAQAISRVPLAFGTLDWSACDTERYQLFLNFPQLHFQNSAIALNDILHFRVSPINLNKLSLRCWSIEGKSFNFNHSIVLVFRRQWDWYEIFEQFEGKSYVRPTICVECHSLCLPSAIDCNAIVLGVTHEMPFTSIELEKC